MRLASDCSRGWLERILVAYGKRSRGREKYWIGGGWCSQNSDGSVSKGKGLIDE